MTKRSFILLIIFLFSFPQEVPARDEPTAHLEDKLDYVPDTKILEKGDFQYFYSLLDSDFKNLTSEQSVTLSQDIVKVFLPLDTKKLWDPKEGHYLAVAKFSYILPVVVGSIDEKRFTDTDYLQSTLPRYTVTKHDKFFHVSGSFITPDFHVTVNFLDPEHPYALAIPLIDREKMKSGKLKVSFMHQDNFGRVMFFRTAKMASALILYEEHGKNQTLVTQFILSQVINVPTKDLIRKGMIENLRDVVRGSRSFEITN